MKAKDTELLFQDLASIIDQGKSQVVAQVNSTLTLVYWQIGDRINTHILEHQRAEYGKEVISQLAVQLSNTYGNSFQERNLRRMMQFASLFSDLQKVSPLATKLNWSHWIELLPVKSSDARFFYARKAVEETWSKRELRKQIERKAFERKKIAELQLIETKPKVDPNFNTNFIRLIKSTDNSILRLN